MRGAHLDPSQLGTRPSPSELARITCSDVSLDFARLGIPVLFGGEMAQGCYTLVFVLECPEKGCLFTHAMEHHGGHIGMFAPGGVVDAFTPRGYTSATLTVPVPVFHAALEVHFPEIPPAILRDGAGLFVNPAEQARFRALIAAVQEVLREQPSDLDSVVARTSLQYDLLAAFLAALRNGCQNLAGSPEGGLRARRIRQAREYIASHMHGPVRLADLCAELRMSARSVEYLFRTQLGVTLVSYIRLQRLNGVRRALLSAEPGPGVVKKAALDWGFWHLGHFTNYYRATFGETPGETLARARRREEHSSGKESRGGSRPQSRVSDKR